MLDRLAEGLNPDGGSADPYAEERRRCEKDPIHWINTHCWTYDPRLLEDGQDPFIRFVLFPRQEEFVGWIQERLNLRENGLAEKSRDCGFTFTAGAYALHGWLFRKGFSAGFGSRKEDLIDKKGDPDSIFEKLRVMLYRLPDWQMPVGFKRNEHDNYMRLINPANGSTITGEAGENIGRGGRKTVYFVDEAAFLENPESVEKSLSQTTRTRIDISTPNGPGNPFYSKRHSGRVSVFTFHWKEDPRKNAYEVRDTEGRIVTTGHGQAPTPPEGGRVLYPWYEAEKQRLDAVTLAQEVDIDYTASVEGICIPAAWVRAAVNYSLSPSGRTVAGYDIAEYGPDKNVFTPRRGPKVLMPEEWGDMNTTASAWEAADKAAKAGAEIVHYDCIGVGAGVRGAYESSEKPLAFTPNAINSGSSPTDDKWPDGKTSKERFLNLRAELWWKARDRFEKTFEVANGIASHPEDELISIPNHPKLISELSMPLRFRTSTGKVKVESKDDMRRRGVKSPNYADSLILSLAPEPEEPPEVETSDELYQRMFRRSRDDD